MNSVDKNIGKLIAIISLCVIVLRERCTVSAQPLLHYTLQASLISTQLPIELACPAAAGRLSLCDPCHSGLQVGRLIAGHTVMVSVNTRRPKRHCALRVYSQYWPW